MAALVDAKDLHFSPTSDAETIRKACEGWATDEKTVITILAHRNAAQRHQICKAYKTIFRDDLVHRLQSELSGNFQKAMYRWMLDSADRDAVLANVAIKNGIGGPHYHVIIEIACIRSPDEIFAVRRAYRARYNTSLEEDLAAHTSGDTRELLVGLTTTFRYKSYGDNKFNAGLAKVEADLIHQAINDDEPIRENFIRMLCTRSWTNLNETFNVYKHNHGSSITKALLGRWEDDFVNTVCAVIRCIKDHKKYYAKVLHNALKQTGADEEEVTRVIVTRAEKDLKEIELVYNKRNTNSLYNDVSKATSGNYKAFLLALLGESKLEMVEK